MPPKTHKQHHHCHLKLSPHPRIHEACYRLPYLDRPLQLEHFRAPNHPPMAVLIISSNSLAGNYLTLM